MNRWYKFATIAALSAPFLTSCGNSLSEGDFELKFNKIVPQAYIGSEYDFGKVLIVENGVQYDVTASYYDYDTKSMNNLVVNNYKFVPVSRSDVTVSVLAYNKTVTKKKSVNVRVSVKGDGIETLLSSGESCYADEGITKDLNTNSVYVKEGNTSIVAKFSGTNYYRWGAALLSPNNFRCLDYWTDKTWENAILTFWVYNPTDYEFEFQLRVKETEDLGSVDIDWGSQFNTPQFAKSKEWTQIFFSMNKIGINRPLYIDEEMTHSDNLIVKTRWHGPHGEEDNPEYYAWSMYIDGVDIVPASLYPEVGTEPLTSFEKLSDGWENMRTDTGETDKYGRSLVAYDPKVLHKRDYDSKTSLKMTFANAVIGDYTVKYSVMFSPQEEIAVTPSFVMPPLNKGTIKADFKFSDDITNKTVSFVAVQPTPDGNDWEPALVIPEIELTDLNDGWHQLYFDFAKVPSFANMKKTIRFGFSFPGVYESNKATASIHLDNFFFDENGTGPAPTNSRGEAFVAGTDLIKPLGDNYDASKTEIVFDYKFNTGDKISISLTDSTSDDWSKYFGYFDISAETQNGTYEGIYFQDLDDGYRRVTIRTWLLDKVSEGGRPSTVDTFYIRGVWSNANGFIDMQSVTELADITHGEPFTAGQDYTYQFSTPVEVKAGAKIVLEIKRTTTSTNAVAVALMQDWSPYFGYFDLEYEMANDKYEGVTFEQLGDGYIRYTFELTKLVNIEEGKSAPTSVDMVYIAGRYTNASGYIDISVIR